MSTPREQGFYMPAEWHPHSATWMAWPGLQEAYDDAPQGPQIAFEMAKKAYAEVANAIAHVEPVNMITNKADLLLWGKAKEDNTILAYEDYLETLPKGSRRSLKTY